MTPVPEKTLTPNQLRREMEKLESVILNVGHQPSQEILTANNVQTVLARVIEQVPLVLDELEWELSSLRAAQKAREAESEKNKQTLYFLLTTVILGFCSVLLISPFIIGVSVLEKWGIQPWIGFIIVILIILGLVKCYSLLKVKKVN